MSTEPGETGRVTPEAESRLWVEHLQSEHPRHEEAVKLEPAPGQNVISHGADRNLSVDEIGGIQLDEDTAAAEA